MSSTDDTWTEVSTRSRGSGRRVPLVSDEEAARLELRLNIEGLRNAFARRDWIELQEHGWRFDRVLKSQAYEAVPKDSQFVCTRPICNGWGDIAIFCR